MKFENFHSHCIVHAVAYSSCTGVVASSVMWRHLANALLHQIVFKKLLPCGTDGQLLFSGFKALVTLIFTLDRVIRHTVMHHSSSSIYTSNFIEIGKTFFVEGLTAGTHPSSRSRDTRTTINSKNLARSNLDIVL